MCTISTQLQKSVKSIVACQRDGVLSRAVPILVFLDMLIIDLVTLAKRGDNALGSVRPSVCGYVCLSLQTGGQTDGRTLPSTLSPSLCGQ